MPSWTQPFFWMNDVYGDPVDVFHAQNIDAVHAGDGTWMVMADDHALARGIPGGAQAELWKEILLEHLSSTPVRMGERTSGQADKITVMAAASWNLEGRPPTWMVR